MNNQYSTGGILARLGGYLLLWLLAGVLIGEVFLALLVGTLLFILWNVREFSRLANWLWHSPQLSSRQTGNSWDHLYYGIGKLLKQNRRRRRQLVSSLGEFREGADALPDGAVVFGYDHSIVWCNRQAQLLLGLRWPFDKGQRLDNLIRHPDFTTYLGHRDFEQTLEMASPTNEQQLLEYRIIPYGIEQFLLVARDITRLHQLEEMRRDFVANVSHEMKTPLTVLQGYLEILNDSEELQVPHLKKASGVMQQQTRRMERLLEQLLALSRIEYASQIDYGQTVAMSTLVESLQQDARGLIGERPLTIEFDIAPAILVYGDEGQLHSACSNLISNAIRYTPDGGEIKVCWSLHPQGVEFSVTDNGEGIADEHLLRLTERFYRVDKSRSSQTGGTGLGLAIVKHVLTNHQSKLNIRSELKQGSDFRFVLPSARLVQKD